MDHLHHGFDRRRAPKRGPSGQHLIEDRPPSQAVDVGGRPYFAIPPPCLLGRNVAGRALTCPLSVWPSSSSSRLARPKSVILGIPSQVNRTFDGLRSRWMIPAAWAAWIARARMLKVSAARIPG